MIEALVLLAVIAVIFLFAVGLIAGSVTIFVWGFRRFVDGLEEFLA